MRIVGKLCATGQHASLKIDGATINSVEKLEGGALHAQPGDAVLGSPDIWISAGFIDTQFNGYGGYNFNHLLWKSADASEEAPARIAELAARAGTPMLCPTIVTSTSEGITQGVVSVARAVENDSSLAAAFPGIHVEGPYISSEEGARGAHPPECIRDPDWDEFQRWQEAAGGRIKILTLAPEREGAIAFIEKVAASGVVVSLGHTAATGDQIRSAVKAGARMSTHLGNGSHAMIPRHHNYIWEQLAEDGLTAGIITDGHHLPPPVVRCFTRVKGRTRTVIVSDAVALGGLKPGIYDDGRHEVLPSGKVVLAGTPYLAGAGHLLDTCVANALRFSDFDLADIEHVTATNPAHLLGLHSKGIVAPGYDADLTLFREPSGDGPLEIAATIRAGQVVYRA